MKQVLTVSSSCSAHLINPFTSMILLENLLTGCHIFLKLLAWRIWYWINLKSPNLYFSLFLSPVCLILH